MKKQFTNPTPIGDYVPNTFHCTICHNDHITGTTYVCCSSSGMTCTICGIYSGMNRPYNKNYCPNCGYKL